MTNTSCSPERIRSDVSADSNHGHPGLDYGPEAAYQARFEHAAECVESRQPPFLTRNADYEIIHFGNEDIVSAMQHRWPGAVPQFAQFRSQCLSQGIDRCPRVSLLPF